MKPIFLIIKLPSLNLVKVTLQDHLRCITRCDFSATLVLR